MDFQTQNGVCQITKNFVAVIDVENVDFNEVVILPPSVLSRSKCRTKVSHRPKPS